MPCITLFSAYVFHEWSRNIYFLRPECGLPRCLFCACSPSCWSLVDVVLPATSGWLGEAGNQPPAGATLWKVSKEGQTAGLAGLSPDSPQCRLSLPPGEKGGSPGSLTGQPLDRKRKQIKHLLCLGNGPCCVFVIDVLLQHKLPFNIFSLPYFTDLRSYT